MRRLTVKKRTMFGSQRVRGTALTLRKKGGFDAEKCVGQVNKAVTKNWTKVMRRPLLGSFFTIFSNVKTLEQHPPNIKPNVVDQGIKAGRAAIIDSLVNPTTLDNLNLPSEVTTDPLSSTGAASTSCGPGLLRSAEDDFGK